jgi:hypothetical protein
MTILVYGYFSSYIKSKNLEMPLKKGDLEPAPASLKAAQSYRRIYDCHKKYGRALWNKTCGEKDNYYRRYQRLPEALPAPKYAAVDNMDFDLGEVISRLMEWAYYRGSFGKRIRGYS